MGYGGYHPMGGMHMMGYSMMHPYGYSMFGTPYYYGGGGMWTYALMGGMRCKAHNHTGIRCNGYSGLFSGTCSFHRDGLWRE